MVREDMDFQRIGRRLTFFFPNLFEKKKCFEKTKGMEKHVLKG